MRTAWSIKKLISLGFAFLVLCLGCVAGLSVSRMHHVLRVQSDHTAGLLPAARLANDFQREMLNARISLIYFVTIQKQGSRQLGEKHLHNAESTLAQLTSLVTAREELSELRPLVENLNQELTEYEAVMKKTLDLVESGVTSGPVYTEQVKQWAERGAVLVGDADKTQVLSSEMSEKKNQTNISSLQSTSTLCTSLFVCGLLLCILIASLIVRQINASLREVSAALQESAHQIAHSSSEIAASSQALAQNASEQAATIEETSAASSEINSMAMRTRENSLSTAEIVGSAQSGCERTNLSLGEMVHAMEAIHRSSQEVSKIVKVIDTIAFQTNILALNASVEAARAGTQGEGFAVVADEVRALAQRCANAAQQTTDLVQESIERSVAGQAKMQQVVAGMQTVTLESQRIRDLVEEIKAGSVEQSRGVEHIDTAISQMEQVTQASAAQSEQGAAAAAELHSQADAMSGLVVKLKILVEGRQLAA